MFGPSAFLVRFSAVLRVLLGAVLLFGASWAQALPSACAATWGVGYGQIHYLNTSTNLWVTATSAGFASPNAMSGYEGDGTLYFSASTGVSGNTLIKATMSNTNTTGILTATVGALSTIPNTTYFTSGNVATSITPEGLLGATFDRDTANKRMFLYATTGNTNMTGSTISGTNTGSPLAMLGVMNADIPGAISWTPIYQSRTSATTGYVYPYIGGSGDIFADQQSGKLWIVTNSSPNRMLELDVTYSGFTITDAHVVGTATIGALTASQGAVAVDPLTGLVYISSGNSVTTWRLTDHTARPSVVATSINTAQGMGDAGNCVAPPDPPTVTKSFNPTTSTSPGTSLMTITVYNPNKVPIYLNSALTDAFPSGMSVHTTPGLSGSCFSDGNVLATRPPASTITGAVGATSVSIGVGAMIPGGTTNGGSCSFSVRVSATVVNLYDNTIASGALSTTAGTNADEAAASFQIQNASLPNLPLISKSFNPTTSTATVGTTVMTIVITNPNTSSLSFSAGLRDILPGTMRVSNPLTTATTCFTDGTPKTRGNNTLIAGTVNSTSATITVTAVIPGGVTGGSCSFSINVSATVAGIYENTIPAGSLTTNAGSNADGTTATYYLRASDFGVTKSQREGATGGTTTSQLDVPSNTTVSYIISIRNLSGVIGTRTFTDTLPLLITPTISFATATVGTIATCRITTAVAGGATRITGTLTGVVADSGCDITVVAKSSTTSVISTATNVVTLGVPAGALDTSTTNNSSTVVLVIKPAANLSITKDDSKTLLLTQSVNSYTITVANGGPADADGAVVYDAPATGLDCTGALTCTTTGGASCPVPLQLFASSLQTTGVSINTFPSGSSVSLVYSCTVTATGLP